MISSFRLFLVAGLIFQSFPAASFADDSAKRKLEFYERRIRPLLIEHCYECHSEAQQEQQGGLLLDRRSGWIDGGETGKAILPGEPDASLLIRAVKYDDADLRMPPDEKLSDEEIGLLYRWVADGGVGPTEDLGETEFSNLGDQTLIFDRAAKHWSFQPIANPKPPEAKHRDWNRTRIDQFIYEKIDESGVKTTAVADARTICRRLYFDLNGLPPTQAQVESFKVAFEEDSTNAISELASRLIESPSFGQHFARLWLDVVRYADTDSTYRPDTRTPHYFPFAFTYRDYVVDSLNSDKPYDQFLLEQFAADHLGFEDGDPETAALGFYSVGPYANRSPLEALDDWIDLTTRGLMGLTVACARCHDHKYEPVPTVDYYSLRGVFDTIKRLSPLDEVKQPRLPGYHPTDSERKDYLAKRKEIADKIESAAGKKARGNNRSVSQRIRETELAKLLTFHRGAPAHAMVVKDNATPRPSYVFVRGDATNRGEPAPIRFLKILDSDQPVFDPKENVRLQLARQIVDKSNPLTARVFVNRVWGALLGSHLVATPSDFGLQGERPTHPELLDHLAYEFVKDGWSVKRLVHKIVTTRVYSGRSRSRQDSAAIDPTNRRLWRANRKRLTIEQIRDSVLAVAGELDLESGGRAEQLWGDDYTHRRTIYGFINRFNLDPTLRAFDFPAPMQSQPMRNESIVASQALFTLNSPVVVDQSRAITELYQFKECKNDEERIEMIFKQVLQRVPVEQEIERMNRFVALQSRLKPSNRFENSAWPLITQAIMMSNEFQYLD